MQEVTKMNHWFVLTVSHNRVMRMKNYFNGLEVEYFVPIRYKYIVRDGQRRCLEVPAIYNLLFVHSNQQVVDEHIEKNKDTLRYMRDRYTFNPVIVSDKEMQKFMLVSGSDQDEILYLDDDIEKFSKYDKVQVTDGRLKGLEGYVVRIRRDRKLVVSIQGVVAVAISNIHPSLLRKI